ncbi:MAG: hypothetical protein HQL66_08050 [Magnetococcales bacterium]|nr:hypothetical protein [Magnetococcales bacterium]
MIVQVGFSKLLKALAWLVRQLRLFLEVNRKLNGYIRELETPHYRRLFRSWNNTTRTTANLFRGAHQLRYPTMKNRASGSQRGLNKALLKQLFLRQFHLTPTPEQLWSLSVIYLPEDVCRLFIGFCNCAHKPEFDEIDRQTFRAAFPSFVVDVQFRLDNYLHWRESPGVEAYLGNEDGNRNSSDCSPEGGWPPDWVWIMPILAIRRRYLEVLDRRLGRWELPPWRGSGQQRIRGGVSILDHPRYEAWQRLTFAAELLIHDISMQGWVEQYRELQTAKSLQRVKSLLPRENAPPTVDPPSTWQPQDRHAELALERVHKLRHLAL